MFFHVESFFMILLCFKRIVTKCHAKNSGRCHIDVTVWTSSGAAYGQIESPTVGAGAAAFTTAPVMFVGVLSETKIPRFVEIGAHCK